jgi:hypothetical protein
VIVAIFLVETYLTLGTAGARADRERRARRAADDLTGEGTPVRFAGSIHIPVDEICFFAFDTSAHECADVAARRAGLEPLRVVMAVPSAVDLTLHHPSNREEHQ